MSTQADQLRLNLGPEAAHVLHVSTNFAHDSFATNPECANINLRSGILQEGFDYQSLDIPHYYLPEEDQSLPVSEAFSIIENYIDDYHNFRGVNPLPQILDLTVRGRVLTEASSDRRFQHVATSILRLTPVDRRDNTMSTEVVIVGKEPANRLGEILTYRLGGERNHKPAKLALRSLSYMRQYHHRQLSNTVKVA